MNIELNPYQLRIKEIAVFWSTIYELDHSDDFLDLIDEELEIYDMIIDSFPLEVKLQFAVMDEEDKKKHIIYDYLIMADQFIKYKEFLYNYPFNL